jgi:hypothetical protein
MRKTCAYPADKLWHVLCTALDLYHYATSVTISTVCRTVDFATHYAHFMYSVLHPHFVFATSGNPVVVPTIHRTNNNQAKLKEGKI